MPAPRQGVPGETGTHRCNARAARCRELPVTDLLSPLFERKIVRTAVVGQGGPQGSVCRALLCRFKRWNLSHDDFFFAYSFFGTPKGINALLPSALPEGESLEEPRTSHATAPGEEAVADMRHGGARLASAQQCGTLSPQLGTAKAAARPVLLRLSPSPSDPSSLSVHGGWDPRGGLVCP